MQPDPPLSESKSAQFELLKGVELRAKALWPRIASDLGVSPVGATFRLLRSNSKAVDRRCVLEIRSSDGNCQVLRADFGAPNQGLHLAHRARHLDAVTGLRTVEGVSVPKIVWADQNRDYVLMEAAPGDTVFRELSYAEYGISDRSAVLQRVGRAIGELHRCSATDSRVFWPKNQLADVKRKAKAVRAGEQVIRRQNRFLGLCAMMHRAALRAKGLSFMGATEHGDLHMRNILITDELVSFIDFSNSKSDIPYRDIAYFWLADGLRHLASSSSETGFGRVLQADWTAFEAGYGAPLSRDPVFQFFYLERIYKQWLRLSSPTRDFDDGTRAQLRGLTELFDWMLQHEPEWSE